MKVPKVIDKYFLTAFSQFSKRKLVNVRSVVIAVVGMLGLFILCVLCFVPAPGRLKKIEKVSPSLQNVESPTRSVEAPAYVENPYVPRQGSERMGKATRSYAAPQVVARSSSGSNDKLPLGTTIPAKLLNTVLSSDHSSPVIALVTEDAYFQNQRFFPEGSKAFGQAAFDTRTKRLQVRFHTFVTPDGHQYPFSGIALLPDGSSGLMGTFHGQKLAHQIGRSSSTFVGGLASGLKEKEARGWGSPVEPGTLKNGLLNGAADLAHDQANVFSDDLKNTEPYLEVPKDTLFLIYFEQAWSPGSPR